MHCFGCIAVLLVISLPAAPKQVACATCHPSETAVFEKSAMGRSVGPPEPLRTATIPDHRAGARLQITQRNGQMIHSLIEAGLSAEYSVRYQVGAGVMGHSYLVQLGPYLFESPASFFKRYGWDLSPGYAAQSSIDFDRVIDDQCLSCHSSGAQFADRDRHQLRDMNLRSISCDRCHGRTEAHLQHPSRDNIINPARLSGVARDSVCEQCHLEGATRILNPGKHWSDFQIGQPAEATFATYLLSGNAANVVAVSQAEQLAQSQCWRKSAGKLWCGTCHNPHREGSDESANVRAVCQGCHTQLSAAAHPKQQGECTSCHMPRNPTTDIPHAAVTDHRIRRSPAPDVTTSHELSLTVWREPPAEFELRDRALAYLLTGFQKGASGLGDTGVDLINRLPDAQIARDPEVLSDLEGLALQAQDLPQAVHIGETLVGLRPDSARDALNYGTVLKKAGRAGDAEIQLERAIALDPSLKQAYSELATLYVSSGQTGQALAVIDRYLHFSPQDILFRLQRSSLTNRQPFQARIKGR